MSWSRQVGMLLVVLLLGGCGSSNESGALKEVQRVKSGPLEVVVLSEGGALSQGKSAFVLEFRTADGQMADVGTVKVNATMAMPGMSTMFGESAVAAGDIKGRYQVTSDFSMAGAWRLSVEWDGPAGRGTAVIPGTVL